MYHIDLILKKKNFQKKDIFADAKPTEYHQLLIQTKSE